MKKVIPLLLAFGLLLSCCAAPESAEPVVSETEAVTTAPSLPPETTEVTETPVPSFDPLFAAAEAPQIWAANCEEYISLRPEPQFSEALAYIPDGETFTLLQWQGRYARIRYQEKEGYVLSNYIQPGDDSYFAPQLSVVKPAECYSYRQLLQDLEALQAAYPDVLSVSSIGVSELGRDIPVFLIGDPNATYHVLLQGAIHGREHMTAWLLMALADFWLTRDITAYGDICYHIIPMSNPDGVVIAQTGILEEAQQEIYARDLALGATTDPLGRYTALWKANGLGVDLNRNFPTGWDTLAGSTEPSSQLFRGEAPFCAAETAALRDYTLRYPFAATISYHAAGSFIYYEYGDKAAANRRSEDLALAVSAVTGYPLEGSSGVDAGGYKDWAIDALEIPSLTVEVGCDRSPLLFREIYSIFARNCGIFPAIAQWLYS